MYQSSFNIFDSTFTTNWKSFVGGVIVSIRSSFNIANSSFTNNGALLVSGLSGVVNAHVSSFSITSVSYTHLTLPTIYSV